MDDLREDHKWRDYAACRDVPEEAFFQWVWYDDLEEPKLLDLDALERARDVCRNCPVRVACHEDSMVLEADSPAKYRFGVRALLTPLQRHTLSKRAWRCKCGTALDPAVLQQGRRECPRGCGVKPRRTPPIPDAGEEWTQRHTDAARAVLDYFNEHVSVGSRVPSAEQLAESLGLRRGNVDRVYDALVYDGELTSDGKGRYTRVSDHAGARSRSYLPPHERIA